MVWRWRSALGGLVVGTALVGMFVGPIAVRPHGGALDETSSAPRFSPARLAEEQAEGVWFAQLRVTRTPPVAPPIVEVGGSRWSGPDGIPIVYPELPREAPASRAD